MAETNQHGTSGNRTGFKIFQLIQLLEIQKEILNF